VKAQQEGYRKAETAYSKAIEAADKAFAAAQKTAATSGDPSILATAQKAKDEAYSRATLDRESAKDSIAKEYDAAVKSIGGTPGSQKTYPYVAADAQGNQYGSNDGVHFFDVKTGKPYQEK
jgi:hypothetical protein